MHLTQSQSRLLYLLHRNGPRSRQQLSELTGWRPNTVGDVSSSMIKAGLVYEGEPVAIGPGRPSVPLHIDGNRRCVLGVAIRPGQIEACRMNLLGQRLGDAISLPLVDNENPITQVEQLVRQMIDTDIIAFGLSVTGLLDSDSQSILFSFALPNQPALSIAPIIDAAGDVPIVFDNDMHAMASRWLLTHEADEDEDLLIVHLRDGAIGAALIIDGQPNRGSVVGGNELGNTQLPVGEHKHRLEQIFSSRMLKQWSNGDVIGNLDRRLRRCADDDVALARIVDLLALGLANSVNLIRPGCLVIASEYACYSRFISRLMTLVESYTLGPLIDRMRTELWTNSAAEPAEDAGYLALAHLYQKRSWVAVPRTPVAEVSR